jgi:competence protein ComGC
MAFRTRQQRRQLAVQGGRAIRGHRASIRAYVKEWIVILALIVGLLTQLGVPDLIRVHTIIQSGWTGTIKMSDPTGTVFEMDNRQGLTTNLEGQKSEETKTETS